MTHYWGQGKHLIQNLLSSPLISTSRVSIKVSIYIRDAQGRSKDQKLPPELWNHKQDNYPLTCRILIVSRIILDNFRIFEGYLGNFRKILGFFCNFFRFWGRFWELCGKIFYRLLVANKIPLLCHSLMSYFFSWGRIPWASLIDIFLYLTLNSFKLLLQPLVNHWE